MGERTQTPTREVLNTISIKPELLGTDHCLRYLVMGLAYYSEEDLLELFEQIGADNIEEIENILKELEVEQTKLFCKNENGDYQ